MTRSMQNIETRIYDSLPRLSQHQKKAASFFLEHMDLVALLPIQEVAFKAQVSEATIVRFAQLLGFRGYKELRQTLSASLTDELSPTAIFRKAVAESEKFPDVLNLASQSVIANIQDTIKSVDPQTFRDAVQAIIQARRIYCLGLEISAHLAQLMTFQLRLYSYDAQYISLDFFRYSEQIAYMSGDDLLIAFSFSPYSRETVDALALAKRRSVPSIVFTDKKSAPARISATHCFQIKTDNIMFSNSLGAVVTMINAIIIELNFKDKERTLRALATIEESIQDGRDFIS
jgi:DNA-binding MurR/RpiR family transcriptional regulator